MRRGISGLRAAKGGIPAFAALAVLAASTMIAAGVAGCRSQAGGDFVALRWIDEPPGDELLLTQLQALDCVVASHFETGVSPSGMTVGEGARPLAAAGRGLTLIGWTTPPRVRLTRVFGPGEVDAARFTIAGLRRGSARLRWFAPGSREPAGFVELARDQGGGTLHDRFSFDLRDRMPADRPLELEVELTSVTGEIVTLGDLCIGRARIDAARLATMSRVPWKVTLADETRDVLIQPAGESLRKSFVLPGAARLSVGFGRLAGGDAPVRLTVRTESPEGTTTPIFERVVSAADLARGWTDLEVDLSPAGAGDRVLVLTAETQPPGDPALLGVWSAPRIRPSRGRSERPNIVLISLDTLRADHLSLNGYGRPTSPRLDGWARARNAAVFRHVVPAAGWTLPSHFSLFTGLNAFRHPANHDTVAIDAGAFSFLAERLFLAGYRTQAFTGGGFVHPVYGLAKGFEGFSYWTAAERRPVELATHLEQAGRWLDRFADGSRDAPASGEPFLLFLHTYEIHAPYTARQPYFNEFSQLPSNLAVDFVADSERVARGFLGTFHINTRSSPEAAGEPLSAELSALPTDLYDSKVAYVDALLAPLLARLSAPPFAANTIVVVFSDHGESLGENGLASHANLALENLQVPLILVTPGAKTARAIESQVRLIDLYPTLLELAGVTVPEGIDGESLGNLLAGSVEPAGRPAWAYGASTNFGVSLLAPSGLKLDWRNSLWKPIAGELRWSTRDGYRETNLATPPMTAEAERMKREIQQVYARDGNGLRFELRNVSPRAVHVTISSSLVDPVAVKSPLAEGVRLDWGHMGFMEAAIAPGATLALRFERTERRQIELEIGAAFEGCATESVTTAISENADQLRQPVRRIIGLPACGGRDPGSSATAATAATAATTATIATTATSAAAAARSNGATPAGALELSLVWHGPLPSAGGVRVDADLRRDLQALGYLH
ncbi:MAG: sulfatase [Thermoanaerobaculia bacterium]